MIHRLDEAKGQEDTQQKTHQERLSLSCWAVRRLQTEAVQSFICTLPEGSANITRNSVISLEPLVTNFEKWRFIETNGEF